MTALRVPLLSAREYLEFEERSEIKHEFVSGYVYMMAGGKPRHNQLSVKVASLLDAALGDTNCIVYNSDQRVRNMAGDTYFYPDCSVACGSRFDRQDPTSLLNPVLVCEVLSPSTEQYDLGDKAERYTRFESLRAMLFVSSDAVRVELRERAETSSDTWTTTVFTQLADSVRISALDVALPLAALYAKTDLPPGVRVAE